MSEATKISKQEVLQEIDTLELAQIIASRLAISERDWHRLKGNRQAQARQQIGAALVFLLKNHPEEAILRLEQAIGWLNGSLSSPPCETHTSK
jgi:hypothetical protein